MNLDGDEEDLKAVKFHCLNLLINLANDFSAQILVKKQTLHGGRGVGMGHPLPPPLPLYSIPFGAKRFCLP